MSSNNSHPVSDVWNKYRAWAINMQKRALRENISNEEVIKDFYNKFALMPMNHIVHTLVIQDLRRRVNQRSAQDSLNDIFSRTDKSWDDPGSIVNRIHDEVQRMRDSREEGPGARLRRSFFDNRHRYYYDPYPKKDDHICIGQKVPELGDTPVDKLEWIIEALHHMMCTQCDGEGNPNVSSQLEVLDDKIDWVMDRIENITMGEIKEMELHDNHRGLTLPYVDDPNDSDLGYYVYKGVVIIYNDESEDYTCPQNGSSEAWASHSFDSLKEIIRHIDRELNKGNTNDQKDLFDPDVENLIVNNLYNMNAIGSAEFQEVCKTFGRSTEGFVPGEYPIIYDTRRPKVARNLISVDDPEDDDYTYFFYKGFVILYDRDDYDDPDWEILGLKVGGEPVYFPSMSKAVRYIEKNNLDPNNFAGTIDFKIRDMITKQLCTKMVDAMTYIKHLAPIGLTEYCISGKANEDIIQWELVLSRIIENLPSLKKDKTDSE